MTRERWLPVVGYETSYMVSSFGRVISLDRIVSDRDKRRTQGKKLKGKPIKAVTGSHGYPSVTFTFNSKRTTYLVHRLVLEAFVGPCPKGYESLHNDGNRQNPRLSNLCWGTKEENQGPDRIRHGTSNLGRVRHDMRGARNPLAKLTNKKVTHMRALYKAGTKQTELAKMFGITQANVSEIVRFKTWKRRIKTWKRRTLRWQQ